MDSITPDNEKVETPQQSKGVQKLQDKPENAIIEVKHRNKIVSFVTIGLRRFNFSHLFFVLVDNGAFAWTL